MDLFITGKFIKECRKEKGLTQAQLAEKISVSEKAVSKWECGKGFPDTSLILPLCCELGITANELLSAKKLEDGEYKASAEKNIILLKAENQKNIKTLFGLEIFLGFSAVVFLFGAILIAFLVSMPLTFKIIVATVGVIWFFAAIVICLWIEKDVGYYECPVCHYKYVPKFGHVFFAMHLNRTRYMKCPKCNKKAWQKKVIE